MQRRARIQFWYIDSECSRHMNGDTSNFLYLKAPQGGGVSFGGGNKISILGIGKIGRSIDNFINNVHYVEGYKYNLLSISQICDRGNKVKFMANKCLVTNSKMKRVVLSTSRVKNMYVRMLDSIAGDYFSCLSSQIDDLNL